LENNADGDRVSLLDANGIKTKWDYDADHRPVAKQYADGSGESWDYTQCGDLNSTLNGRNARTTFGYSR
jgi:YD repeat-containing protein